MATLRCTESGGSIGIMVALERAMPGDEVVIGAGEYRFEHKLSVKSQVHLRGEDNARLIYASWLSAIKIFNSDGAKVSNLTIELSNVAPPTGIQDPFASGINIYNSNDVVIEQCVLDGNGFYGDGIIVGSSLRTKVFDCRISNFGRSGIKLSSSQCVANNNKCAKNSEGIRATRYSKTSYGPSELTATNNCCHHNRGTGIILISSNGTLVGNKCWRNKCGIGIDNAGSSSYSL